MDFGIELTFRFGVTHSHGLTGEAVSEHFDFEGNIERAFTHEAIW